MLATNAPLWMVSHHLSAMQACWHIAEYTNQNRYRNEKNSTPQAWLLTKCWHACEALPENSVLAIVETATKPTDWKTLRICHPQQHWSETRKPPQDALKGTRSPARCEFWWLFFSCIGRLWKTNKEDKWNASYSPSLKASCYVKGESNVYILCRRAPKKNKVIARPSCYGIWNQKSKWKKCI